VRQWNAQTGRLRAADEFGVLAAGLISRSTVGTGVVGCEERADHELTGFDRAHFAADLLDDATVLVPHRCGRGDRVCAPVGHRSDPPQTPHDLTAHNCINLRLPTHGGLYA